MLIYLHQRKTPGLAIFSYLAGDKRAGEAVVIDPIRDIGEYIQIADQQNFKIGFNAKNVLEGMAGWEHLNKR